MEKEVEKENILGMENYLTLWSIIISYIIFVIIILFKDTINISLFLFGTCLLTSICIVGTLFISVPISIITQDFTIILRDFLSHIIPFIIFLFLFKYLSRRISSQDISKIKRHKVTEREYIKYFLISFIFLLILLTLYTSFANLNIYNPKTEDQEFVFNKEIIFVTYILIFSIFISSYKIFYNRLV